ncbi:MAG TPA: UDP-N-acetylglucosamine pyrophosphorylase [Propioniciclava tarda]|nr:UDP-N-acetylglucosamine pyrophosphorylase [Propioniciclava tarda]HQA31069.1 UDP-N-acetylglucosamine pyrophosphorylase [Propioniciclava tarda]HQD61411.1 UDP-N-acetylglucosamine pyrophosphorylase [Propioniciclava tarda]
MTLLPRGHTAVADLLAKGVVIPNPGSLDVDDDVDIDRISGDAVVLHPGTRLRGAKTVISAGCVLGAETPVTVENCQLGGGVHLKGGYVANSTFLDGANLGLGAHVREGCILEEEASGAHCVGLKQTILFPFVTLGSLINFCDCLLSGGTSRSDHSEVGSSYIHFNFTPDGDKTTASLFGDVPRGVMLDQPPIFLGGQGGAVGPVHTGFGTIVGAGSILRGDVDEDGLLVLEGVHRDLRRPAAKASYRALRRVLEHNVDYLASLVALDAWYRAARRPFFDAVDLGPLVLQGALDALASGRAERIKRLLAMIAKVPADGDPGRAQLVAAASDLPGLFDPSDAVAPVSLVASLSDAAASGLAYVDAVRALEPSVKADGTAWLTGIVSALRARSAALAPDLGLFG